MNNNHSLPWIEKYRPLSLNELVHHDAIKHLLRSFITKKNMPNLFFYGPPGTGKTSAIMSCANELYGSNTKSMVLHLNASDERGIDVVRKQIMQFATTNSMFSQHKTLNKLVILDEADSMSEQAQIALRDVMEYSHALFCFIGNYQYPFQKQLQSRIIKLLFTPITKENALQLANHILGKETQLDPSRCVSLDTNTIERVYDCTNGDMRQFINVLQILSKKKINSSSSFTSLYNKCSLTNVKEFIEKHVDQCDVVDIYNYLYTDIVIHCNRNIQSWLVALMDYFMETILQQEQEGSVEINQHEPDSDFMHIHSFCTEMAQLERRLCVLLTVDVQLLMLSSTLCKIIEWLSSHGGG